MMPAIRDFIYLDLPRLQSYASQLLQGLPESQTRAQGQEADFEGEVRAGLPSFLGVSATTKGVLSAGATITSSLHHQLVALVLDRLEGAGYLWDLAELSDAPDGSFTLVSGDLQVTDVDALREILGSLPNIERYAAALTAGPQSEATPRSRADRRAGRAGAGPSSLSQPYLEALIEILDQFGSNNVRVRLLREDSTIAVGVAERDKFVEDLRRLTSRHGYRMPGPWHVLAQANKAGRREAAVGATGESLLDIVENSGMAPLEQFSGLAGLGATTEGDVVLTPLSIFRVVSPRS